MDELKTAVAAAVQEMSTELLPDLLPKDCTYEVQSVTRLITRLRVKGPRGLPRYFDIQVKETL